MKGETDVNENKNNDIKFEDLVDNYTYQQNGNQENKEAEGSREAPNSTQPPIWSNPQPEAPKNSGFNVAALVLGILSIVCCYCTLGVLGIVLGGLAVVFYIISKKRGTANGMALGGLICGICGIALGLIFFVYAVAIADEMLEMFPDIMNGSTLEL